MDFRGISWRSLDSYGPLVGLCSTFLQPPSLGSWVLVLSVSYSLLQSLSYHHFWSISYSIFMLRLVITSFIMCAGLNCFSRVWLFATLWTVALQAHLPMGFPGQEYCSGSRSLFQGSSWPRDEPVSPTSVALAAPLIQASKVLVITTLFWNFMLLCIFLWYLLPFIIYLCKNNWELYLCYRAYSLGWGSEKLRAG